MLLFVDETENEDYFIVTGLLVESQNDIDLIYSRFKKKAKNLNISDKKRAQLFTEFKSTLMDRNYQKLKISMLSELSSIEHYNLCSTCRHHLDGDDPNKFYDIIQDTIKEV